MSRFAFGILFFGSFLLGAGAALGIINASLSVQAKNEPGIPIFQVTYVASSTPIEQGVIVTEVPVATTSPKRILVSVDDMKISLEKDGTSTSLDIVQLGKAGSVKDIVPDEYAVQYKTRNHFSPIGGIYMPYGVQFFGNNFIHGTPTYPSGEKIPSSGLDAAISIRVSDVDAKKVYEFAELGTPLVVEGSSVAGIVDDADPDGPNYRGSYTARIDAKVPKIAAKAYLVADVETGDIILEKFSTKQRSIASLTKMMTALVSLENLNQFKKVTLSQRAASTLGNQGHLQAGQKYLLRDLLYPLLMESSNDAAEAIAEYDGRSDFIDLMNEKAEIMNLEHTSYADPSGLSANNVSSARDLFILAQHIFKHKGYIFDVSLRKSQEVAGRKWNNSSKFIDDDNYQGGKDGYTSAAGYTLVSLFELPIALDKDGDMKSRTVAIILLGSDDRESDARAILKYVLKYVTYVE